MPFNELNLAQNVRRLAGMHLVSIDKLAQVVGVNRQTMQAIVKDDPLTRSRPKAETANRIAEEFGVSLNDLYQDPIDCLQAAVDAFEGAPIRQAVEPPPVTLEKVKKAAQKAGVPVVARTPSKRTRRQDGTFEPRNQSEL